MKGKFATLLSLGFLSGFVGHMAGLSIEQATVLGIFSVSIFGTLFFWDFRISFVFIGSGVLLLMGAVNVEEFIHFASLDVILFLISMMIIVGMMKEAGFFMWLITVVLRIKNLTGLKMFIVMMAASMIFSGLMDEVTSIIIMTTVILNLCDFLEIDPKPMVISSIMATNIGSASTVLGNPVGILIAARSGLSFEDFISHALPVSFIVLVMTILILIFWFRRYIQDISKKLAEYQGDKSFLYLISIPADFRTRVSMAIFGMTIFLIALHKRLELFLNLQENTLLLMLPVIFAGIVLLYRHDKARHYVEKEVEWMSLLFFLFLFAQAGVVQASGIALFFAEKMTTAVGHMPHVLTAMVLFLSGILSSLLDNVVVVASFVPIVKSMAVSHVNLTPLWWALLFGACFGGNITVIGSTANIVALGLLEKEQNIKIAFWSWFKVGLVIGLLSMAAAFLAILFIPIYF